MLQRIESPNLLLAFRAVGKIEKSDYKTILEPAIDPKSNRLASPPREPGSSR